ncbi:hypothetical protein BDZ91DRAFT_846141 [Kalaharituber pfeilii]|nr:hypothetical protein BDZ91DRAFT_846141 [Kalaharituber pfeilii]
MQRTLIRAFQLPKIFRFVCAPSNLPSFALSQPLHPALHRPRLTRLASPTVQNKTPDVLTLFHSPNSESSTRILSLLKSSQPLTGTHTTTTSTPIRYELDIITAPALPTPSQYKSIVEFLGGDAQAKKVLREVSQSEEGAGELAAKEGNRLEGVDIVRPLLVDWNNGRVVVGDDDAAVKKIIESITVD